MCLNVQGGVLQEGCDQHSRCCYGCPVEPVSCSGGIPDGKATLFDPLGQEETKLIIDGVIRP